MKDQYKERIEQLLSKMTLEEKVGQLKQCGPSLVGAFEVSFEELLDMMFDGKISHDEFERLMSTATQDYHEEELRSGRIGSYNGISDAKTANRLQKLAVEETRLGIPLLFGYDVIHGFETVTPIPLAESCAWEPKLWEKTARMAAEEATAGGVHMTFAPMVDVAKDARWGRISEGAGEDPLLNACYGAAKVRGFQGDDLTKPDAMIACVKHFAGYGAAESGKDYNRVDMSMQRLWEEYLPGYQACIKAGARAVMPAFNDINGTPCTANHWLLKDILRKKWGFGGVTVSDANAIAELTEHGIAEDLAEAAKKALLAGTEIDMTSNVYAEYLPELIQSKNVKEDVLDEAVFHVLHLKFEAGLFEHPYRTDEVCKQHTLLGKEYRETAREAAAKSMVLLKNTGILPLKKEMKLGIFGSLAADRAEMTGAWSIKAEPGNCISIIDACKTRRISYEYHPGTFADSADKKAIDEIAKQSDVLLVAVGEQKNESGEAASRADITLPLEQLRLVNELQATGRPVIAVLFNGRPLALQPLEEKASAILEAWHPGTEAGNAVMDILYGDINPSGKLTTTFPYTSGQCPIYYAHMNTGRPGGKSKFTSKYLDTPLEPLYPFGYGLSYTEYTYSDLTVQVQKDGFRVSVQVKNTGSRDGDEIIQCYVRDINAQRARPVKELKAFEKRTITAGQTIIQEFIIPYQTLGYYDQEMNYIIEPGTFKFYVGGNVKNVLECEAEYQN